MLPAMRVIAPVSLFLLAACSGGGEGVFSGLAPGARGEGPSIAVTMQDADGAPVAMAACNAADGPGRIGVSFYDSDGLANARLTWTGTLADGTQMTPAGSDISLMEGGGPGDEQIRVLFRPEVPGAIRTSVVLSLTTEAPFTGILKVEAVDRTGKVSQAGPFEIAAAC